MLKKPIFINLDKESGYIGLKCSNPKISCTYLNGKKIEVRKYYDKVINFKCENGYLKSEIMNYSNMTSYSKFKVRYKLDELCLKTIYFILSKHYKF